MYIIIREVTITFSSYINAWGDERKRGREGKLEGGGMKNGKE